MKNIFMTFTFLLPFLLSGFSSKAVTISIDVKNDYFDDDFVTANVGDVIEFEWKAGNHTTTSDTIPAGAAPWDAPMNSSNETFLYTLTVAGHYHYYCAIHGQMMSGIIEVSGATGIFSPLPGNKNLITVNQVSSTSLSVHYQYLTSQKTVIRLYNLVGSNTQTIFDGIQSTGDYVEEYTIDDNLTPGTYFLSIESGDIRLTRKISIQ